MARPIVASLFVLTLGVPAFGADLPRAPADTAQEPPAEAVEPRAPIFTDRLDVELETLVLRVVDRRGVAIAGLGPGDFRLFVGRRELPLESADWISAAAPQTGGALLEPGSEELGPLPGQLVVVFVQTDLQASRLHGLVQMLPKLKRVLDGLAPEDHVAVVSFDSHLKLRQEFTRDRERIDAALEEAIRLGPAPARRRTVPEPSLAAHLDPGEARRAANPERALELVARAIEPLEQPRVLIYLGWGLGEMARLATRLPPEYFAAVESLTRSRTSVFVLDATVAEYHSLELGLRQVARDTGGSYEKTVDFPELVADRLTGAIVGHYVLAFRPPAGSSGAPIRVELREPGLGRVLMPAGVAR